MTKKTILSFILTSTLLSCSTNSPLLNTNDNSVKKNYSLKYTEPNSDSEISAAPEATTSEISEESPVITDTEPTDADRAQPIKPNIYYSPEPLSSPNVSTVAGSGIRGSATGAATSSEFDDPQGVVFDASGNLYVVDQGNNCVKKITPAGILTNFAGSNSTWVFSYLNGTGSAARFWDPQGLTIDSSGNIFVADTGNRRIRKITPAGVVSNFAGSGAQGSIDGPANSATFNQPQGLAFDSSGNLYVTDNHKIRKITPTGDVSTFAGSTSGYTDGTNAIYAQFSVPTSVAIDSTDNVYVADSGNHRIRKITQAGVVTTIAGSGIRGFANGAGTSARFNYPDGITIDRTGNILVTENSNHKIRKVTTSGIVSTIAGSGVNGFSDGTASSAQFSYPFGITTDSAGAIYVADPGNNRIRKIQ